MVDGHFSRRMMEIAESGADGREGSICNENRFTISRAGNALQRAVSEVKKRSSSFHSSLRRAGVEWMTLWSEFLSNDNRIINKWKHYFPVYERHFKDFVYQPVTFIEIGCGLGGSLQMWKRYFGPHARIIGIDIDPECKKFEEDQVEVYIGQQQDFPFLQGLIDQVGTPDIVLDDGSHVMSHVMASFQFLYPKVAKNGIYMVEDLHTAYWDEYEGGLRKPSTFIEACKNLIDELNADHNRGALPPTEFTKSTLSMHFYDSIVVFERGTHTKKCAVQTGGWPEKLAERVKRRLS